MTYTSLYGAVDTCFIILLSNAPGVSGEVILDEVADRIPNYWVWQISAGDRQFSHFAILRMISEEGQVGQSIVLAKMEKFLLWNNKTSYEI